MAEKNGYGVHRNGSPYSDEECDSIISKLEDMLDGQLDPNQQDEVQKMVDECEYCLEQYNIERSLRKLVKDGFKNIMVSNKLVDSIKNAIKTNREKGA